MALPPERRVMRIGQDAFARWATTPTGAGPDDIVGTLRLIARRCWG